jgi:hypothetical protein
MMTWRSCGWRERAAAGPGSGELGHVDADVLAEDRPDERSGVEVHPDHGGHGRGSMDKPEFSVDEQFAPTDEWPDHLNGGGDDGHGREEPAGMSVG